MNLDEVPKIVNFERKNLSSVLNILTLILQNYVYEIIPHETTTIQKSSFNSHVYWDTL